MKEISYMNSSTQKTYQVDEILRDEALDIEVTDIILNLGIHASSMGYRYLRAAIMLAYNCPSMVQYPTKTLYPQVAKYCGATPSIVERNCRRAIDCAYLSHNSTRIVEFFNGRGVYRKPTCKEFILGVADYLHMAEIFN